MIGDANSPQPWIHVVNIDSDVCLLIIDVICDVTFDLLFRVCSFEVQSGLPCLVMFIVTVSLAKL